MKKQLIFGACIAVLAVGTSGLFYVGKSYVSAGATQAKTVNKLALHVYKTPTCGCCTAWIDHLESANFDVQYTNLDNLEGVKANYGVSRQYQSCHTGVTADGYAFEGHVPAKYIAQFLAAPPADAIGLSVPAMPVGSPGMEVGDKFMPYQVLLLKKDGSHEVFADVPNYEAQF